MNVYSIPIYAKVPESTQDVVSLIEQSINESLSSMGPYDPVSIDTMHQIGSFRIMMHPKVMEDEAITMIENETERLMKEKFPDGNVFVGSAVRLSLVDDFDENDN